MDKIVGREAEQKLLNEAFSSKDSEFIVVYGRRRIGKTFLIEQFFNKKKCIFFQVVGLKDGALQTQLGEFSKTVADTFYKGLPIAKPSSWMQAFELLTKAILDAPKNKKFVLFFDELPWMATKRSKILQALDYFWNRHWSKNMFLKLIVCGSSASWIIKNIIYHKAGLHNRYTRSILLKPFSLLETKCFLESRDIKLSERYILMLYMVMGGVPHYLKQLNKNLSDIQNINNLCFKEDGILFSEFDKLFQSLFSHAKYYIELVTIIASHREGIARVDIAKKTTLSTQGGILSDRLENLESAGFIKAFLPLGHQRQGIYYRVIDEYTYFYLNWIAAQKKTLLAQDAGHHYWPYQAKSPAYYSWMGYAFEAVCYKHLSQIRQALDIQPSGRIGAWRYNPRKSTGETGAQIDLLFERDDEAITVCEIKCSAKPFVLDKAYYEHLLNKINIYKRVNRVSKQVFLVLISASGVKKTACLTKINQIVELKDLFES